MKFKDMVFGWVVPTSGHLPECREGPYHAVGQDLLRLDGLSRIKPVTADQRHGDCAGCWVVSDRIVQEVCGEGPMPFAARIWLFMLRWVAVVAIVWILLSGL